ncbi:MAG: polysaccharide deacetylase family protein [Clostridia bacterium]|nr:polysaccharide deacetylase family protein [Clostridia bacterium]
MTMMMRLPEGKAKVLTLSYDDGTVHDIRMVEILDKYGLKATFNINSSHFLPENKNSSESGRYLTDAAEAKKLYSAGGHEIALHTVTHPWIQALSSVQVLQEVLEDRKNIEREFGIIARGMAYPFGCFNDEVVEALRLSGIAYSRTTVSSERFNFPDDWLRLGATCHHINPRLMELAKQFVEEQPRWGLCNMFYLWGHSYEFNNNNNWEVLEEFAELTGGRDDIWYATNIEIYDYVTAYNRLETSVDCKIIHNPTAVKLWFAKDGEIMSIEPGETITVLP